MNTKTATETFTNPLYLESGRILEPYEMAYETYGELSEKKDNAVVVCHALSGSHHAAGYYEGDRKPGWWDSVIGPGKVIDTDRFFVICTNVIGSCFGSTGPMSEMYPSTEPYRFRFPVITVRDMVKAQRILFDRLGIYHVHAVIGGSMGGLQALQFGIDFPNFASKIIPLAMTHATQPSVIASLRIMMESIRHDPAFHNGYYDPQVIKEEGMPGLAVARMVGFLGYLSPSTMENKFSRNYVQTDGLYELFGRFEVERYLEYNGNNFPKWFDPLSYLYLIKALSIYDATHGYDHPEDAYAKIRSKMHLISFSGDELFYPHEMLHIKAMMNRIGHGDLCEYYEVDSDYGHDAFLVEIDKFGDYLKNILESDIKD